MTMTSRKASTEHGRDPLYAFTQRLPRRSAKAASLGGSSKGSSGVTCRGCCSDERERGARASFRAGSHT